MISFPTDPSLLFVYGRNNTLSRTDGTGRDLTLTFDARSKNGTTGVYQYIEIATAEVEGER
jgi:hypothetical protein